MGDYALLKLLARAAKWVAAMRESVCLPRPWSYKRPHLSIPLPRWQLQLSAFICDRRLRLRGCEFSIVRLSPVVAGPSESIAQVSGRFCDRKPPLGGCSSQLCDCLLSLRGRQSPLHRCQVDFAPANLLCTGVILNCTIVCCDWAGVGADLSSQTLQVGRPH